MSGPNIDDLLRQGVEAARSGDKLTARRLLQQVLLNDKNNVTALMWMASVVDTLEDRRAYLQRVLQVDPSNERAREALRRLGGAPPTASGTSARPAPSPVSASSGGGSRTALFVLAVVVLVAVVMIVLVLTAPGILNPSVAVQPTATRLPPTATSNQPQVMPTLTPNANIIPLDQAVRQTLPPSFTPPPTLEPTIAPTETPLPPGVDEYSFISSDFAPNAAEASLRYFNSATGTSSALGEGEGYGDVALSSDGRQIAFVRLLSPDIAAEVTPEPGVEGAPEASARPQLFIGELSSDFSTINNVRQLTTVNGTQLLSPTFSPDGQWIAFAGNEDGDFEIYRAAVSDGRVERLTDNTGLDTQPAYHPLEANLIVFVSDQSSPGFTDLYTLDLGAQNEATRLYDAAGNAYEPSWSVDGAQIAFISTANADPDVFVIDADGSRARQLTIDDSSAEDRAPAWTPDSTYIAFASNRDGDTFQWYAVNISSNQVSRMAQDDNSADRLVFVP